jgi:hypothetical protein
MRPDKMVESNNAFVKREEMKLRSKMGNKPVMPKEMYEFDAYMSNDGASAQEFARDLTRGIDDAFPVK